MESGKNLKGTVLVIVLIIITFVVVVATTALRSGTLLYELALDRVEQTTQLRAAQALAYYGIAYCKNLKKEQTESEHKDHRLTFDQWPPPKGIYQGTLTITPKEKGYLIQAILEKQGDQLCSIQSEIGPKKKRWKILSWDLH